jgi:preprotein translocase subunit SecG
VEIKDALNVIQFILALVLILVILMQTKGASMGGIFGGESSSVYRTRRGFERRLFQFTIGLSVVFFLIAIVNSMLH